MGSAAVSGAPALRVASRRTSSTCYATQNVYLRPNVTWSTIWTCLWLCLWIFLRIWDNYRVCTIYSELIWRIIIIITMHLGERLSDKTFLYNFVFFSSNSLVSLNRTKQLTLCLWQTTTNSCYSSWKNFEKCKEAEVNVFISINSLHDIFLVMHRHFGGLVDLLYLIIRSS